MTTINDAAWDAFVRSHPRGTPFHLSAWTRAIERALRHRGHFLTVWRETTLAGVLPLIEIKSRLFGHALLSNAFAVGGGPLGIDDAAELELMNSAALLAKKLNAGYVELKNTSLAPEGWVTRDNLYCGFERPIASDEAECLLQIPRKQRAVLRKALDSKLSFTIDSDVDAFFSLFARTLRNHGTPVFPKMLFQSLKDAFGDDCEVLTIRDGATAVSSVMSFYFGRKVLPYYTGSVTAARDTGANDLMYWRLMRHASARGSTIFDFGRSKVGTGPFAFKKNWGFQAQPITHQYYLHRLKSPPNINPTNAKFDLLVKAWRRLPLPVANRLGPFISRNLG